jgi:hypothetical protein
VPPQRSPEASVFNRWGAITAVSPLKPWRVPLLRLVLWFGTKTTVMISRLLEMKVIAFARFTLLPNREHPRFLLFETNWTGSPQNYIPDFAVLMPTQWRSIWGNTRNFPGPLPATRLLEHIATVDWGTDHYFSDYRADASTQTVVAARELQLELEELARQTASMTPDRFAIRWASFTTRVQDLL